jgi:hypothetical protein
MPFVSDDQRKAVFAKLKKKGGGSTPKPPKAPKPPKGGGSGWTPGQTPGTVVGTGGAIYGTPAQDWYQAGQQAPAAHTWGNYQTENGVGPYEQQFTPTFTPPETLWGELYDIATGVAEGGNIQWPAGTPGQLTAIAGTIWADPFYEQVAAGNLPPGYGTIVGGVEAELPGTYLNPKRNKKRPWWAK